MTSICFLILASIFTLAGCQNFNKSIAPYPIYSSIYSLDDLSVETDRAAVKTELGEYNGYKGRVIKVMPRVGILWTDYSRPVYLDLEDCVGLYEITVSMSLLTEKPAVEKPPAITKKQPISAYKPEPVTPVNMVNVIVNELEYNGPANIGFTIENGLRVFRRFGGDSVVVPEGEWVDLVFSQVIDMAETGIRQLFIDGLSDDHGLVDLILYFKHFQVTKRKLTAEEVLERITGEIIEALTEG